MADLRNDFDEAVAASRRLSERPDNATLLRLYALYKQATEGDASGPRPGLPDLVGGAKHDAWAALQGKPAEQAMREYVELVDSLK